MNQLFEPEPSKKELSGDKRKLVEALSVMAACVIGMVLVDTGRVNGASFTLALIFLWSTIPVFHYAHKLGLLDEG